MTVITAAKLREEAAKAREIADQLAADAAAATAAEAEARRPKMPPVDADGLATVITFVKYQSGREYNYAAVGWRVGRNVRWSVTGTYTGRYNWPGLLAFIGEANWHSIAVVTETRKLLPPELEPPVVEQMGGYGRVIGTQSVEPGGQFAQSPYA